MPELTRRALRIGGCLVLAVSIAACIEPAATSQQPSPTKSARPSATPGSSAVASPSASLAPSITPIPSPDASKALVALLPAELGGVATQKLGVLGSDVSLFDPSTALIFESILTALGAQAPDMAIGIASANGASIVAIRVTGESAADIGEAMIAGRSADATPTKGEVDLGGKHAIKVTTTKTKAPFYIYASNDISFTVTAPAETIVAEALSKLP